MKKRYDTINLMLMILIKFCQKIELISLTNISN